MKLKTSIFLTTIIAATSTTTSYANPVWDLYAGLTIGAGAQTVFADHKDETNAAQSFGALFGIDVPAFRFEAEYNYLNESDVYANVALVNAYFKMPSTVIKPYLGVGAGVMFSGKNDKANIDFDTTAAYQAMLGVTLDVPALPFKFDVEARAMYLPDIYDAAGIKPDVLHYDARVKMRYIF